MRENPLLETVTKPWPKKIGIVGAGTIGPDIGYYLKSQIPGLELTLIDISDQALQRATERIHGYADKGVKRGKISESVAEDVRTGIVATSDYDALIGADWVLEAATENLALKRRIFADCETRVAPDALLTSNTSSLPAARIFAELNHPQRATVTHFFAPAFTNPIVEVINWKHLSERNLAYLRYVFAATGKVPLVTRDVVCFMLDRLFDNWCNESALLLEHATAEQIDMVARQFVMAGPFFVLNLANGNPIIVETNELQAAEEGEHYTPAPIFRSVDRWRTLPPGETVSVPPDIEQRVSDRLRGIVLSQSLEVLDRDIGRADDLELGARLAFGFKRGPLEMLQHDVEAGRAALDRLARERPGMPLPKRDLAQYRAPRRFVLRDRVDDVVVITIRRPEALNALHDQVNGEILAALREVDEDPGVRGAVLTGYGPRAFCAGADIGRFPALLGDADAAAEYARECSQVLTYLDRMQKPVVAAINGMALGGGLELAIRCHDLVATADARLQFPEITLGIVPGIGAMVVPFRRWGAQDLLWRMLLQAQPVTARQALDHGIISELADTPADLLTVAIRRVGEIDPANTRPRQEPVALSAAPDLKPEAHDQRPLSGPVARLLKECVESAAAAHSLAEALEVGYRGFGEVACTADAREGIEAFLEKREPRFSQR